MTEGSSMSLIQVVFSAIIVVSAVVASLATDMRRVALSMWLCGLSAGGLYLSLGGEFLAVTQSIISTLIAISFIFFGLLFGEYGVSRSGELKRRSRYYLAGGVAGTGFLIWIASGVPIHWVSENSSASKSSEVDLLSIGKIVVEDHSLSLQILALILFLALIGSGVMVRSHSSEASGSSEGEAS